MAILGNNGILEISRQWPDPLLVANSAYSYANSRILVDLPGYWTGDKVLCFSDEGFPIDFNSDSYADCPNGHAMYFGSLWDVGPSREHIESDTSGAFYASNEDDSFFNTESSTGLTKVFNAFIRVDALGNFKFFQTRTAAHNNDTSALISFKTVQPVNTLIAQYSVNANYSTALATLAATYQDTPIPSGAVYLTSLVDMPSDVASISADPDQRGWLLQCDLTSWAFNINAQNLDTTSIGELYGDSVKAIATGAGTLEFILENKDKENEQSSLVLHRLALLTQSNYKASVKLYIYKQRTGTQGQVDGSAFYKCEIIIVESSINVTATDIITGSASFLTVGEYDLILE